MSEIQITIKPNVKYSFRIIFKNKRYYCQMQYPLFFGLIKLWLFIDYNVDDGGYYTVSHDVPMDEGWNETLRAATDLMEDFRIDNRPAENKTILYSKTELF